MQDLGVRVAGFAGCLGQQVPVHGIRVPLCPICYVLPAATGVLDGPVRSDFGFHVIQLRDVKEGKVVTFEEARPEIEKALAKTANEKAVNTAMGVLADEAYKNPASFAATAAAQKLPFEKIGPVMYTQPSANVNYYGGFDIGRFIYMKYTQKF